MKPKSSNNDPLAGVPAGGHSRFGKGGRDLLAAPTLRPSEVHLLYGMPASTVCGLCSHPDPAKRITHYKVPGRQGRRGSCYIDHAAFKIWLQKWRKEVRS